MPQAALQPGKGPSCECSKRLGWPLCSSRCFGDKKSVLPLPRIEPKFFGILHIIFHLILLWLSNRIFNSNTLYVQMVFEADAS